MTDYEFLLREQDGAVLTLTLNRPEALNALSRALEEELHAALDAAAADDSVRVIVLTGAGRAFSAGYDISGASGGPVRERQPVSGFLRSHWNSAMRNPDMMMHIMQLPKPVIAAINGWCVGGGFWYSLACDITIASDRAVFAQPEVRMISNTTVLFALLAGWKHAHRYALTGDHFDAQEALRIGVINEVVPHDQLMERSYALAHRLAQVPPDSVRLNKAITSYGLEAMGLRNALNVNGMLSALVEASNDGPDVEHLERARAERGFRGFMEARDGPFTPEPFGPRAQPRD
ncbi:MAG: enoyl-CoA hydratase/isomerase family protein [Chloroflexi bacterium]|nr:enoyl-CoA hydratase/isomerase family protein [Chloroflexota bacterium]MDA1002770.1 enoyl-CoA hydratase/isomerase family protein [Chloroflexota bacterium]